MKQFFLLCVLGAFVACNTETKPPEAKTDTTAKKEVLDYPYKAKYGINWQPGDEKNAVLALNAFKKWVDGDVKGSFAYFADSIEFYGDKFHFNGTKDSLLAMFTPLRAEMASMSLAPDTWLTTYYPDYNLTWVTIWATEYWTDKKGKKDSLYVVDDMMIKDGKIRQIDEKQRLFAPPVVAKK